MNYLKELADKIHANSVEKGFWNTELSNEHCLCLVVSELMEAVEADRKQKYADVEKFKERTINFDEKKYAVYSENYFKLFIKDTTADELADAYIRLLDLVSARNIEIDFKYKYPKFKGLFTENIFRIVTSLTNYKWNVSDRVNYALMSIESLAKSMDIDLIYHVELKMKYNALRPYMHGKQY